MKVVISIFLLIINNIISYSELRIFEEEIHKQIISIYDCKTSEQGYKSELTLKGYFISLSSFRNVNITSIQRSFSYNLFLIIDENIIQPAIIDILHQFSAVFLLRDLYSNRTVYLTQGFLCQVSLETIKGLAEYNMITMSANYQGELYRKYIFHNKFS